MAYLVKERRDALEIVEEKSKREGELSIIQGRLYF